MSKPTHYWFVCVFKAGGGKKTVFTYRSTETLKIGSVVSIPFKRTQSLSIAIEETKPPKFKTREISQVHDLVVPNYLLDLATWMSAHYTASLARVYLTLLPANINTKPRQDFSSMVNKSKLPAPKLQSQQQAAIKKIMTGRTGNYLLHGATGSGKTMVYIELAKATLKKNKSAIILVPEISLTPQITSNFRDFFGQDVILTHSGMGNAERRFWWRESLNSKSPKIIIGPRSALFMPVKQLGLIVIDECHESTYKQEQSPRYNTINVAAKLASITKAKLVLGSATPAASDVYLASQNKLELVAMPRPVYKNVTRPTKVIDMSKKTLLKRSRFLSESLLKEIEATLARGKQTILFMNRRGSARVALCGNCNWVSECPNCNIPLTFHADRGVLLCHWCNFSSAPPAVCPICKMAEIHFLGGGTKRIEAELNQIFPKARIARLDRDSFDSKTMPELYQNLLNGKVDVLIGTQMVTKGLDLPNVETIGVVLADTMLYMPDFTAAERTFQLLYQVRGRAGRREGTPSQTIIQTYSPKHPAIKAVVNADFEGFVQTQLEERRSLHYPPFVYLLKLWVSRKSRSSASEASKKLVKKLKKITGVEVVGPAPAWRETFKGEFTWQVIVKSPQRERLVEITKKLGPQWTFDLDPINLL